MRAHGTPAQRTMGLARLAAVGDLKLREGNYDADREQILAGARVKDALRRAGYKGSVRSAGRRGPSRGRVCVGFSGERDSSVAGFRERTGREWHSLSGRVGRRCRRRGRS